MKPPRLYLNGRRVSFNATRVVVPANHGPMCNCWQCEHGFGPDDAA